MKFRECLGRSTIRICLNRNSHKTYKAGNDASELMDLCANSEGHLLALLNYRYAEAHYALLSYVVRGSISIRKFRNVTVSAA